MKSPPDNEDIEHIKWGQSTEEVNFTFNLNLNSQIWLDIIILYEAASTSNGFLFVKITHCFIAYCPREMSDNKAFVISEVPVNC